ncbi:MAG: 2,3-bisphosphoglycerate-independent phosphoglycerate mutase [Planctomycetota bacterium]
MKYALIIPDGAADRPLPELGGRTPFEAAVTPNLDRLAAMGRLGTARTTPDGFGAGSDVCSMSLIGYDPAAYHTGRAPLEAAALGITGGPADVVCRVNLVTVDEAGRMLDHSAGGIDGDESRALFDALTNAWTEAGLLRGSSLHSAAGYRAALVDRSGRSFDGLSTTPPHEIPGETAAAHAPSGGEAAAWLNDLMDSARPALAAHPVNNARRERGVRPATNAWIWGQGTFPSMPSFESRFGLRGCMLTAVDLLAGIAQLVGWDRLDVPGLTGWHDNDYVGQGRAAAEAIDRYDLVCCHVESPDEAAHQADATTKTAAIEAIDRHCVGPIVDRLAREPAWRVLVLPDHYTLCGTRKHDATPVPFLVAGSGIAADSADRFTETNAEAGGPHCARGHELLPSLMSDLPPGGLLGS